VEPAEILQVSRDAIYIMLKTSGPLMLVALGVGLVISLFQALTQMQEATISFVPKIVAVFLAMMLLLPLNTREHLKIILNLLPFAVMHCVLSLRAV
jgi:flagellar biosynthetic protein FliQ